MRVGRPCTHGGTCVSVLGAAAWSIAQHDERTGPRRLNPAFGAGRVVQAAMPRRGTRLHSAVSLSSVRHVPHTSPAQVRTGCALPPHARRCDAPRPRAACAASRPRRAARRRRWTTCWRSTTWARWTTATSSTTRGRVTARSASLSAGERRPRRSGSALRAISTHEGMTDTPRASRVCGSPEVCRHRGPEVEDWRICICGGCVGSTVESPPPRARYVPQCAAA